MLAGNALAVHWADGYTLQSTTTKGFAMSVYLILDTKIENVEVYEHYKKLAKPIAEQYGGSYRVRGGAITVIESTLWTPTRIVIIDFPDTVSAQAFIDSKEYAPVKLLRQSSADCTAFIVEES
ncbi:MAG: hypothetical protein ACI9WS_002805 [Paraglaciecola psychrophila]|jgi:uncharacterized protein (DUF1330 family)